MYDNSQAQKEKFSAPQLADKVAFDERCMLNWHCCGGKKAKQNNKRKKQSAKNFTPVKFDATTSKVWHRNILADMKYLARLQRGCSRWMHTVVLANTCQSALVSYRLIRVNDFIGMTVVQKQFCQVQNVGYILTNRKTIHRFKSNTHTRVCVRTCGVWQWQQMNLGWNRVSRYNIWSGSHPRHWPCLKASPEQREKDKRKRERTIYTRKHIFRLNWMNERTLKKCQIIIDLFWEFN